jgi:hypothetical protein
VPIPADVGLNPDNKAKIIVMHLFLRLCNYNKNTLKIFNRPIININSYSYINLFL